MSISPNRIGLIGGRLFDVVLGIFLIVILAMVWNSSRTRAQSEDGAAAKQKVKAKKIKASRVKPSVDQVIAVSGTCTITGVLGSGSTDHPFTTGQQTPRLVQNGVDSSCVSPKACPGTTGAGNFTFDAYQFQNTGGTTACVSVSFQQSCGANQAIHPVAYSGAFNPNSICTNYLADLGHSIDAGTSGTFSFNVAAGGIFTLVIHELGTVTGCSSYTFTVSGLPDCTAPACSITCPANITKSNDPNQCGAVVTYPAPSATSGCGTVTCSPQSGSFFPVGTTTVTCTTQQGSSCTFTVTVVDNQPPTITCPLNQTAVAAASCPLGTSAVVSFAPPVVSDNCPGVTVVCNPPSGSPLPVGTTSVTCTATDTTGNTATCSFTVSVFSFCLQDETNPGNFVLINATTGDYSFFCNGVLIASGRGTLTTKVCIGSIEHVKGDRRVYMEWDTSGAGGKGAGTAIVQLGPNNTRCQITDKNMQNNTCTAPAQGSAPEEDKVRRRRTSN